MSQRRKLAVTLLLLATIAGPASVLADEDLPLPEGKLPASILTDFDVMRDGLSFGNNGHYTEPDGDCFGMSLLAIRLYVQRNEPWRKRERERAHTIVSRVQDPGADVRRAAAAAIVQYQTSKHGDDDRENKPYLALTKVGPHLVAALKRIEKTGVPEILSSEDHSTVLFGYRAGKILVYDPNFPGRTIEWPFDERKGLGAHPEAPDQDEEDDEDTLYTPRMRVSSTPVDRYLAWKDTDWAREGCDTLAKKCLDYFPTITASVSRVDGKKDRVVIQGTAKGGLTKSGDGEPAKKPEKIWVIVNGAALGSAVVKKGAYRIEVAASAFGTGERDLRVVATCENDEDGALAGFLETKVTLEPLAEPPAAPTEPKTPGFKGALDEADRR